jgi:ribonuclease G
MARVKGSQIILGEVAGREAAALIVDGLLEDLIVDSDLPRPGAIYRARANRPMKGQGGLFLDMPDGSAYLRGTKGVAPGERLLVQVTGHAEPGKATPVTARLLFKSRYAIVTPDAPGINVSRSIRDEEQRSSIRAAADTEMAERSGFGIILRSACAGADPNAIAADVEAMGRLAETVLGDTGTEPEKLTEGPGPHELAWRDWPDAERSEAPMMDLLDEARRSEVRLPAGAAMHVEPTRALVAVDVNTGADTSPAAGLKANIAAARALPRALRVRGLGGQVVMDVAPMPKRDRQSFESALRAAFRSDGIETALIGWTPMGHYEMNRQRVRAPLHEILR